MSTPSIDVTVAAPRLAPGQPGRVVVRVRNDGSTPVGALVHLVGIDPSWAAPTVTLETMAPGATAEATIVVTVPAGFPPCEHQALVMVQPIDAGQAASPSTSADFALLVGLADSLQARLEPEDVRGRGRFLVQLENHSNQPVQVRLEGNGVSPKDRVSFADPWFRLEAGTARDVRGRLKRSPPFFGADRRIPFTVFVEGQGTRVPLPAAYTQKASLSGGTLVAGAVIGLVLLWLAGLGLMLNKVSTSASQKSAEASATARAAGSAGNAPGNGGGGGAGGGGGGDAAATPGPEVVVVTAPLPRGTASVNGKVTAADPSGVTVSIEPTSLGNDAAFGADFGSVPRPPVGKAFGGSFVAGPSGVFTTVTDETGNFAFAGVKAPGFQLLTFSKAGYQTQSNIVATPDDGQPVTLNVTMVAGRGSMAGRVTSGGAGVGGADITVSSGKSTLTTKTDDASGSWSIAGLETPGSFLVSASRNGFGTQTRQVDLAANDAPGDIDLELTAGVGSVAGTVRGADGPIGELTVVATSDATVEAPTGGAAGASPTPPAGRGPAATPVSTPKVTRTATTLSVDPKGSYLLTDLPIPGAYTITVTGPGWLTATQHVDLSGATTLNIDMLATTTRITGVVTDASGTGLSGVGITLSDSTVTLKTTSAADGGYEIQGVPPGTYFVSFALFEYTTASRSVTVLPGDPPKTLPVSLTRTTVVEVASGTLAGSVKTDAATKITVTVKDSIGNVVATPPVNTAGEFSAPNLAPGVLKVTAEAIGYQTQAGISQTVGNSGITRMGVIDLVPWGTLSGTAKTAAKIPPVPINGIRVEIHRADGQQLFDRKADKLVDFLVTRTAGIGVSVGTYTFERQLPDGQYNVYFDEVGATGTFAKDAAGLFYVHNQRTDVRVTAGAVPAFADITLDQMPMIQVRSLKTLTGEEPSALAGAAVTIKQTDGTPAIDCIGDAIPAASLVTTAAGLLPAPICLTSGSYLVDVTATGLTPALGLPLVATVNHIVDAQTTVTAVLRGDPGITLGTVFWLKNGNREPVVGATVSITGVFVDGNGQRTTQTFESPDKTSAAGGFLFPSASSPTLNPVSIRAFGVPGFSERTVSASLGVADVAIELAAAPGTLNGSVAFVPATLHPAAVTATLVAPTADIAGVNVLVDPVTGAVTAKSGGADKVPAGRYTVRFTATGWDSPPADVTVDVPPAGTGTIAPADATLTSHSDLEIRAKTPAGAAIPDAIYRLTYGSTDITCPGNSPACVTGLDPTRTVLTFKDLRATPDLLYRVRVSKLGYGPDVDTTTTLLPGEFPHPVTAPLTQLGTIKGHLTSTFGVGQPSSGLINVIMTATCACGPGGSATFDSAPTDKDGLFEFKPSVGRNGLFAGDYTIKAKTPIVGYQPFVHTASDTCTVVTPGECQVTLATGANPDIGTLIVIGKPSKLRVEVTHPDPLFETSNTPGQLGLPVPLVGADVTITGTGGPLQTQKTVAEVDATGKITAAFVEFDVVAGNWNVRITAATHSESNTVAIVTPGSTLVHRPPPLAWLFNTVTVAIRATYGSLPNNLDGATITINRTLPIPAGAAIGSGRICAGHSCAFTGLVDGTYTVSVTKTGYQGADGTPSPFELKNGNTVAQVTATLPAETQKATVTVKSSVAPNPDLIGARVTLRGANAPDTANGVTYGPTAVGGGAPGDPVGAAFPGVVPGTYTISIDFTSATGHTFASYPPPPGTPRTLTIAPGSGAVTQDEVGTESRLEVTLTVDPAPASPDDASVTVRNSAGTDFPLARGASNVYAANLPAGTYRATARVVGTAATDYFETQSIPTVSSTTAATTGTASLFRKVVFTSTAPTAATVKGATYTPTASALSAAAVITVDATTSTVCRINGAGVVSFTAAGTCLLDADRTDGKGSPDTRAQQSFTVGKGAQTVSFASTAPAAAVFGGATYRPTATATSGLAVTITVDATSAGVCSITGGVVSFNAAGTCLLNADQAGNVDWTPAARVQQSFAVAKADQTVRFTSTAPSGKVGGATYSPRATATSGLAVTITVDATSAGVCSITGGAVSFNAAGTCLLNADQAGDTTRNAAPQVQQSVTVTRRNQTVAFTSRAPNGAKVADTYTPTADATPSGLTVTITVDATAAAVCSITAGVVTLNTAGTCVLNADQAGDSTWNPAPQVQQSFKVV